MDALDAVGHLQEIDWATHQWRDVPGVDEVRATELDDDNVVAYGALNVAPFGGINCRRIRAYFVAVDSHSDHIYILDTDTAYSRGECY